jgi:hypothetical protein
VVVNPVFDLMAVEANEATDLDDGNAPLVGEPADVTHARSQAQRDLLQGEEARGWTKLPADRTAQRCTIGRTVASGAG